MKNKKTGLPGVVALSHFNIKDSESQTVCVLFREAQLYNKNYQIFLFLSSSLCPSFEAVTFSYFSHHLFLLSLPLHPRCDTDLTFTLPFPIHFQQMWHKQCLRRSPRLRSACWHPPQLNKISLHQIPINYKVFRVDKEPQHELISAPWVTAQQLKQPVNLVWYCVSPPSQHRRQKTILSIS